MLSPSRFPLAKTLHPGLSGCIPRIAPPLLKSCITRSNWAVRNFSTPTDCGDRGASSYQFGTTFLSCEELTGNPCASLAGAQIYLPLLCQIWRLTTDAKLASDASFLLRGPASTLQPTRVRDVPRRYPEPGAD